MKKGEPREISHFIILNCEIYSALGEFSIQALATIPLIALVMLNQDMAGLLYQELSTRKLVYESKEDKVLELKHCCPSLNSGQLKNRSHRNGNGWQKFVDPIE